MKMDRSPPPLTAAAELAEIASAFAALGSEQRLTVLTTLVRAGPDGLSIGTLGARCGISGSTLTHHLKILSQSGLILQTRQGREVICAAAAYDRVRLLSQYLLSECCADRPGPDAEHAHD